MYAAFEWLHLNKPNQTKQTILRQTYAQMIIWNEAYSFYLELVEREREKTATKAEKGKWIQAEPCNGKNYFK